MADRLTALEIGAMIVHAGTLLESDVAATVKRVTEEEATTNIAEDKADFQTPLDLAVEDTVLNGLQFSGLPILSEERFKKDKSVLQEIENAPGYWIVDPVDGSDKSPGHKGTLLALVLRDGPNNEERVVAAWAYTFATDLNPPILLSCVAGMGVERNGHLVHRSFNHEGRHYFGISKRALAVGDEDRQQFETNKADMNLVPHESSIHALNEMVAGRANSFTHIGAWPWDFAAIALMTQELGGTVRKFSETKRAHAFAGSSILDEKEAIVALMPSVTYDSFAEQVFKNTSWQNTCRLS
jgi:fructose-1,6-bisphosphatase/inositol monophosphatase family enzyme